MTAQSIVRQQSQGFGQGQHFHSIHAGGMISHVNHQWSMSFPVIGRKILESAQISRTDFFGCFDLGSKYGALSLQYEVDLASRFRAIGAETNFLIRKIDFKLGGKGAD